MTTTNVSFSATKKNIRMEAIAILKTAMLLNEKFSASYMCLILRGRDMFLRNETHKTLETFGTLKTKLEDEILLLIDVLIFEAYLIVKEPNYGTLGLTEKGKETLATEHDIWIEKKRLIPSETDKILTNELKSMRKNLAAELSQPTYYIFNDFQLRSLVQNKPETLEAIKNIAGFGDTKWLLYGKNILEIMQKVKENAEEYALSQKKIEVQKEHYQGVKRLFEEGMPVEGIAAKRSIKTQTVCDCLITLHEAGELNLANWVVENIPAHVLLQGKDFFLKAPNATWEEANSVLGLDYLTLRFTKIAMAG
jgi:ATP-dependent DNA helicase RecQ